MKHLKSMNESESEEREEREEGYYWLKRNRSWNIYKWAYSDEHGVNCWHPFESGKYLYEDSDFEEIDENQIVRSSYA